MDGFENIDLLVVGAGLTGCTIVERAASVLGWKCAVIDRRTHIAGNCYDHYHSSGIYMPAYAPQYFSTDRVDVLNYLSRFTAWIPAEYKRKSLVNGESYTFPINLETLRKFFDKPYLTEQEAEQLLEEKREKTDEPQNAEEYLLSLVGRELYEVFFRNYAFKLWGEYPDNLDVSAFSATSHIHEGNEKKFSLMPVMGYTAMFERMLQHENIMVKLNTEYAEIKDSLKPLKATLFTGPIDEYFNHMMGALPRRPLRFENRLFDEEFHQSCVQVDYTGTEEYVYSFEIKHISRQKHPQTLVSYAYPGNEGDFSFPVPTMKNFELYEQYRRLGEHETFLNKVYFAGNAAWYSALPPDETVSAALEVFSRIQKDFGGKE